MPFGGGIQEVHDLFSTEYFRFLMDVKPIYNYFINIEQLYRCFISKIFVGSDKALVIRCSGFFGGHLIDELLEDRMKIFGIDCFFLP